MKIQNNIRICEYCKKEFLQKWKYHYPRRYCSRSCGTKAQWSNPIIRENMTKINKEVQLRIERKNIAIQRAYEHWNKPGMREKMKNTSKVVHNKPDVKMARSLRVSEYWSNPDNAENHMKKAYSRKKYILPSGKTIFLQGYEYLFLTDFLKNNSENDIVIGIKNIYKYTGKIKYEKNGKQHSYYPDFYIKSTNTIIEVKSSYTYKINKEKDELKKLACLNMGFNFEFKIYDSNRIPI